MPVVRRSDLREAQARVPPFGDYLCVPDGEVFHIHGTSRHDRPADRFRASAAPTGDAIANAHARIMWGMGMRPGDTVFIAAIFSLYMGSLGRARRRRAAARARRFRSAPARPA